jgi:hypothetical protein
VIHLPPEPPSAWPGRFLVAGIALAVLLVAYLAVRIGRRWRVVSQRPVSAEEQALTRLAAPGDDPAGRLAEALRDYVAERFEVEARSRTTGELLRDLEGKLGGAVNTLGELLGWSDEVKFAGRPAEAHEVEAIYDRARQLVRATSARVEQDGRAGQTEQPGEVRRSEEGR